MHTDLRLPVGPLAEVDIGWSCALAAVLWEPVGIKGGVLVIEAPRADNLQAGGLRSLQTELYIRGILQFQHQLAQLGPLGRGNTDIDKREIVGIGPGKVEVIPVELEPGALGRDEALGRLGRRSRGTEAGRGNHQQRQEGGGREEHVDQFSRRSRGLQRLDTGGLLNIPRIDLPSGGKLWVEEIRVIFIYMHVFAMPDIHVCMHAGPAACVMCDWAVCLGCSWLMDY